MLRSCVLSSVVTVTTKHPEQGSADCGPGAKSELRLPASVPNVGMDRGHTRTLDTHALWVHTAVAELSNCDRDHTAYTPELFTVWASRERFADPDLEPRQCYPQKRLLPVFHWTPGSEIIPCHTQAP